MARNGTQPTSRKAAPLARLRQRSFAEISGRIARFRAANLEDLTEDQIDQRLGPLMDGHMAKIVTLTTNRVYRARKISTAMEIKNVAELWYPPAKLVQLGRFNRPAQSVFYAASTLNAALWEVRPSEGDRVTIAVCATREPVADFRCAHLGLYHYAGRHPTIGDVPDVRSDAKFRMEREHAGVGGKWRRIDEFFADLATGDERERGGLYGATVRLGEMMMRIPEAEGLAYPSVVAGLAAFNLRLEPAIADAKLFVAEVWEFEFLRHFDRLPERPQSKPGYALMRPLRRSEAIKEDGSIAWARASAGAVADYSSIGRRIEDVRKGQAAADT